MYKQYSQTLFSKEDFNYLELKKLNFKIAKYISSNKNSFLFRDSIINSISSNMMKIEDIPYKTEYLKFKITHNPCFIVKFNVIKSQNFKNIYNIFVLFSVLIIIFLISNIIFFFYKEKIKS